MNELDALWAKHVGSSKLSSIDEMKRLWLLQERREIPHRKIYLLFLRTKRWSAIKLNALRRDGFACVKCGATNFLHVDHLRYPKRLGDELLEDLQTLCWNCHEKKTQRYDMAATAAVARRDVKRKVGGQLYGLFRKVRWKRENIGDGVQGEARADKHVASEGAKQGTAASDG